MKELEYQLSQEHLGISSILNVSLVYAKVFLAWVISRLLKNAV